MRELRMYAQRLLRFIVRDCHRHERDVVQVACPYPRKVGVTESGYSAVRIKISCNPVPSWQTVVRTELYHAEWRLGSRVCVSCEISPDERVDDIRIVCFD